MIHCYAPVTLSSLISYFACFGSASTLLRPRPLYGALASHGTGAFFGTEPAPATETSKTLPSDAQCVPSCGGSPGGCGRRTRSHSCAALRHRLPRRRPWLTSPSRDKDRTAVGASVPQCVHQPFAASSRL